MGKNGRQCGIDEAGRGPVIGPLVMSIVCGDPDEIVSLGARDSKKMTPSRREKVAQKIRDRLEFTVRVVPSTEINGWMSKENLNRMEEKIALELIGHASAVVYVDSFDVDEARLSRLLSTTSGKEVHCMHRADDRIPAVSAASIISKVERDRIIRELSAEYGNMGSGYPSDPVTVEFLTRAIREGIDISGIVRTGWSTYRRMLSGNSQGRLL
ncbi:MAG: ribonuclease HII [Candidatus Thermoplasmatota archaeon]|nr:ribonuclease HII [Candidatus Thermoplasmatota archaeon]